jgi:hypothetical protein
MSPRRHVPRTVIQQRREPCPCPHADDSGPRLIAETVADMRAVTGIVCAWMNVASHDYTWRRRRCQSQPASGTSAVVHSHFQLLPTKLVNR